MKEIWKEILGYEGYYEISNYGRVRSLTRVVYEVCGIKSQTKHGQFIKPYPDGGGYACVGLNKDGVRKPYKVHRLVAENFIDNPENKREVNHINRDKFDNSYLNLEWVTPKENMKDLEDNHNFNYGRRGVIATCVNTGDVKKFKSLSDGAKFFGSVSKLGKGMTGSIQRSLKDNRKVAFGHTWSYIECID